MADVFRDPVHGLITFQGADAAIGRLVETAAVQRLRRVRQMGFAQLAYPGAEHSRFGHALGAYHVASRLVARLSLPAPVARDVKVAALLHDVGHGPFSHAWEVALGGDSHEAWGRRIVAEDEQLHRALEDVAADLPAALLRLLGKDYAPRYARKLVSSQLDADRMDYLLRDAHYSGVGYSAYDLEWILHVLRLAKVHDDPVVDDGQDLVIDYRGGMHAVEQYLFGRFYMYAQVYYHKAVRAAETLFLGVMRRFAELARNGREPVGLAAAGRLARGERISVNDYLGLDDAHVLCALDAWARDGDSILADLAGRLIARRLFKTLPVGDDQSVTPDLAPVLADIAKRILGEKAPYYWTIDRAKQLGYDARPGEEIFVIGHPHYGTTDLGRLVQELPLGKQTCTVRVVCAPELAAPFAAVVGALAK